MINIIKIKLPKSDLFFYEKLKNLLDSYYHVSKSIAKIDEKVGSEVRGKKFLRQDLTVSKHTYL